MATTDGSRKKARLYGLGYSLIAVVFLLSGEYLQTSLWGCLAAISFFTLGQDRNDLPRTRRILADLFQAGFVLAVVIFISGYFL